jgi:hypothetical protein
LRSIGSRHACAVAGWPAVPASDVQISTVSDDR